MGIGILCEDRQKVVLCADRLATMDYYRLRWEVDHKLRQWTSKSAYTTAITMLAPGVLRDAGKKLGADPMLDELVGVLNDTLAECLATEFARRVLVPLSVRDLGQLKDSLLSNEKKEEVLESFDEEDLQCNLILGAFDVDGAHLVHYYSEKRRVSVLDGSGLVVEGSGKIHAFPFLVRHGYSVSLTEGQAVWLAFAAKKQSELDAMVGPSTDVCVVGADGVRFLTGDEVAGLERAWTAFESGRHSLFQECGGGGE